MVSLPPPPPPSASSPLSSPKPSSPLPPSPSSTVTTAGQVERADTEHSEPEAINAAHLVKLPPFWKENPVLYGSRRSKQHSLYPELQATRRSSDILATPPIANKYETLKQRIIGSFDETNESKLRRLLRGNELADEKPSSFLQRLRNLSGSQCTDAVLRTLFLEQLPDNVRSILAISEVTDLSKLAMQADKITDMSRVSVTQVNAVAKLPHSGEATASCELKAAIDAIAEQLKELRSAQQRDRSKSRGRDKYARRNKSRSKSQEHHESNTCYYHRKFGQKAFKCLLPCEWKDPKAAIAEN
ncbi:uncharacterized protein LOC112638296 [Camponotus floridanus]|uniref:uncharacterized protein LOC112638296 n=1 Tax=Camponotus floridanus TaxID=104421 RepID=UPI000DC6CAF8|nr:uncharacterized protein LOC112638296 [Camponotus floridanus]